MSDSLLTTIEQKIENNIRLSPDEGLALLSLKNKDEIAFTCKLADRKRRKMHGDVVHFASTLNINPTNLCELNCPFCSFYAKPGWEKAWFLTPEAIEEKVRAYVGANLTEIHIVGGLWRDCNLDYYKDVFTRIKKVDPKLHIKALTPVEFDFLAKLHGISIVEVFEKMMGFGLGSLPGGGAEILVEKIRKKIAPGKITSDEYLAVHATAHKLGLHSNITMLFGHIEDNEDILTHLMRVRDLQDQTHGFKTFIPLKFGLENNALGKRKNQLKEKNVSLIYAVSRLMLDNIPHLKVLWNYVGIDTAIDLLDCGVNDFSSTNLEEKIIAMASSKITKLDLPTMTRILIEKGRTPKLTHTGAM